MKPRQYRVAPLFGAAAVACLWLATGTVDAVPRIKMQASQSVVPQAAVPLLAVAPQLDGAIGQDEWQGATAFTGLMSQRNPYVLPEPMQGVVYVGYDAANLYVGLRSALPPACPRSPKGLAIRGKGHDDSDGIESGDHWSVRFLLPDAKKKLVHHLFYINPNGDFSDQRVTPEDEGKNRHVAGIEWESGAQVKAAVHADAWEIEMAIPLTALGYPAGVNPGTAWRTMFSRARGSGGTDRAEWNGAVAHFADDQAGLLLFSGAVPGFQLLGLGELRESRLAPVLHLFNPGPAELPVNVRVAVESGAEVLSEHRQEVMLKAGERQTLKPAPATFAFKDGMTGRVVVSAESAGDHLYFAMIQTEPLTQKSYREFAEPPHGTWPFPSSWRDIWELKCAAYPYFSSVDVTVNAGLSYLPETLRQATRCRSELRRTHGSGKALAAGDVTLVQGKGELHWGDIELTAGQYEVTGQLFDHGGQPLGPRVTKRFARDVYPWEHNRIGVSDKVYPPFTPIRTDRAKGEAIPWGRCYKVGACGLPGGIVATAETPVPGQAICGAFRLEATTGELVTAFSGPGEIHQAEDGIVRVRGTGAAGDAFGLTTDSFLQYDGWWQVSLTVAPQGPRRLDRLELIMPLGMYPDTMWFYRLRAELYSGVLMPGTGVIWNNLKKKGRDAENVFTPVLACGNGDTALWWFADGDESWRLDYRQASQQITRDADGINLRMLLVNRPVELTEPLTFTFAINANPVRPDPPNRRFLQWGGNARIHDTSGYAYWGTGVDSITAGSDAAYGRLRQAVENWVTETRPQRLASVQAWNGVDGPDPIFPVVFYNSGELLGPSMAEYESFSGEWCGESPLEYTPEFLDSDRHALLTVFKSVRQDWRSKPRSLGPVLADLTPSCVDCRIWHYQQNMGKLGINGYWFDNASIWPGTNVSTGRAYRTADGTIRPRYPTFARRDLFRRLFVLYKEAGREPYSLINTHTSFEFSQWRWTLEGDSYVYRFGGDLFETLERQHQYDIISRVTETEPTASDAIARFRGHTCLRRVPGAMVSNLHPRDASGIHGSRSVIGMALLHDFGVEGGVHAETLARVRQVLKAFGLFTQGRIEFIPYWRSRDAAIFSVPQVPVSLYRNLDSGEVLAVLLNPGKTEAVGTLELDGTGLGLAGCTATDPEAVEPAAGLAVTGTARRPGISVSVAGREYRLVLVEPAGR